MKILGEAEGMTTMAENIMVMMMMMMIMALMMINVAETADTNDVFDPCSDSKVQKMDGFTFGLAFSNKESFFFNQTQLSPCDKRLSRSDGKAQLALFRPKVDEISLLSIDSATFDPALSGAYMVAFAGRQYAARSQPTLVADNTHIITSFTLVLEFQSGTLENLYWKKFGCEPCSGDSNFVCLNDQDCGVPKSMCKSQGGTFDCSLSLQLTFSGTDKNLDALNSWYELKNLRQYSLFGLFSSVRDSLIGKYDKLF